MATFLLVGSIAYVISNSSSTVTLEEGSFAKGYSFIVLVDGSTYKAFNGTTGALGTSGSNDDTVIQYAVDQTTTNGGSVFVMSGSYSASVTLKDNVTLILDKGASTITVTIDSGADATLIDYENGYRKEWVSGSLYTFMDLQTGEFWWQGQNRTDLIANPTSEASYIVETDGTNTWMTNTSTGQRDWSSTDASAIFNACVGNLTNGGDIFVRAGTYIIKAHYQGTIGDAINLDQAGVNLWGEGDATILQHYHQNDTNALIRVTADDCGIYNLKVKAQGIHSDSPYSGGNIYVTNCEGFHIERVTSEDPNTMGIQLTGTASNGTVTHCTLIGSVHQHCIATDQNTKYNTITFNLIKRDSVPANQDAGINVAGEGHIIHGNTILGGRNGIAPWKGTFNCIISDNTLLNQVHHSIGVNDADASNHISGLLITGNMINTNGEDGIDFAPSTGGYIYDCTVEENFVTAPVGIDIDGSNNITIRNNDLEECTMGIDLSNSDDCMVFGDKVRDSGTALNIETTCDDTWVALCDLRFNTDDVGNQGTSTIWTDNLSRLGNFFENTAPDE